jgi:hypothetical protein
MATNPYGIPIGAKDYASRTYEVMTREQWQTYLTQFVPIENQLIDYVMSPQTVQDAVTMARHNVARSFGLQQQAAERRMRGLGVELNEQEQQAMERRTGLAQALADVNAANQAVMRTEQRQRSILGNPAPNVMGG